jgi:sulfide:quinone oxidoreductase
MHAVIEPTDANPNGREGDRPRILIAGGGVAGVEALLAIRDLLGERVTIEVLAPDTEFVYRQLAVAEPFSAGEVTRLDLREMVADAGGVHRRDALAEVRPGDRVAISRAGTPIAYDALVLAIGGRPAEALPGAITYRGLSSNPEIRRAVLDVDSGQISSIGFAVPTAVKWALPIYELALLAASHLDEMGDHDVDIHLITHEVEPLGLFGEHASATVRELLAEADVHLHAQAAAARVAEGRIMLQGGGAIPCDRVVAMPRIEVDPLPGVPQGPHGLVATDRHMRVEGLDDVYAAGDATWFPVKQGGIAAQQADAAAGAIAATVDATIAAQPFDPILRGAILTGSGPRYLRAPMTRNGRSTASRSPLWWPPGKVAGRLLAPFLAARAERSNQLPPPLEDLEAPLEHNEERLAADHDEAVQMCLMSADSDARWGDYEGALRWLAAGEKLAITLPADYALRRQQWREAADAARVP